MRTQYEYEYEYEYVEHIARGRVVRAPGRGVASIARSRSRAAFLDDDDDDARHDHSRDHLRHRGDAAARANLAQRRAPDAVRCGEGVRPVTVRVTTTTTTTRCDAMR
jgi:hypothetical protein